MLQQNNKIYDENSRYTPPLLPQRKNALYLHLIKKNLRFQIHANKFDSAIVN